MKKGILVLAAALMTLAPTTASAAIRGGVFIGGPGFYGGWYGPGWGPYYWGPYWGPYYYGYPYAGEVKIDTKVKDAQVFINGAYAGTTKEDKTMHLRPGSYNIEIKEGERTAFSQQVYVAAGKTTHLHPEL
jgi:PEGA domain